jgi:hypothetical protein
MVSERPRWRLRTGQRNEKASLDRCALRCWGGRWGSPRSGVFFVPVADAYRVCQSCSVTLAALADPDCRKDGKQEHEVATPLPARSQMVGTGYP